MAKCVQHRETQIIVRVSNDEAEKLVAAKTHKYVGKQDWKRQNAKAQEATRDASRP